MDWETPMSRTIQTTVGTWKGMPEGFDFDGRKGSRVSHRFQGDWDTWGSREALLEHFREKTWITPADLSALAQLWDEFAGK
jgi:hypothetical protein